VSEAEPVSNQIDKAILVAQRALGGALRELRKRAGLTQKQLGDRASADDTYLSQVENGQRDIRWSTVTRLLIALDMSVADLAAAVERQAHTPRR
jgi:transcriptional regulator with XRE-family HTH domain